MGVGAPKGHPKWGGKKKGSKHKRTLAEEACARACIDPFDLLCKQAIKGDVGCIIQLCKHIEPPRKPLDVAMPEGSELVMYLKRYEDKK